MLSVSLSFHSQSIIMSLVREAVFNHTLLTGDFCFLGDYNRFSTL
jgi:hypothetical protein